MSRNRLLATVLVLAAPVLAAVVVVLTAGHTPSPLPSHWDTAGHVDGTSGRTGFVTAFLVISLVVALAAGWLCWQGRPQAWLVAGAATFVSWVFASALATTLLLASGAHTAASVELPWYVLVASVLVPLLAGIGVWRLHPPMSVERSLPTSTLTLGQDERVAWVGSAHSIPMAAGGVVLLVAAAALVVVWTTPALILGVVGLALVATCSLSVRVDAAGLHTHWGPLGWPRMTISLDRIASATAQQIDPMRWGGWGYRLSSHGTAAVVRRGPGIVVEREQQSTYAVTVDGADRAVEVLNALLVRYRASHPS